MSISKIPGLNATGNNCRGLTFVDSFCVPYLVCKDIHLPTNVELGIPETHFKDNSYSTEFFRGLGSSGENSDKVADIYRYLNSTEFSPPVDIMITGIAEGLKNGDLLVYSLNEQQALWVELPEACIYKTDVELESEAKKIKNIPDIVQLIPVRYALDESQVLVKQGDKEHLIAKDTELTHMPHGLPKKGKFSGGYFKGALTQNSYTLRQLTDGWLYVWDDIGRTMHEYEVKGNEFTRYIFGADVASSSTEERGTPSVSLTYIEYPSSSVLYMKFSAVRWTWRLLEAFRGDYDKAETRRSKWGARKVTCSIFTEAHTGLVTDMLDSVADIGESNKAKFPLAVPSVVDRKSGEDIIIGKPIQTADFFKGKLPDVTTARVVALDDIFSDVNDMVSQIGYLHGLLYENNEIEMAKRATAKAVVSFCTESSKKKYPGNVTSLTEADFLYDLNKYYKDRKALDSYTATHYKVYDVKASKAIDASYKKLIDDFETTYDVAPSSSDCIKWNLSKHRDYADFDLAIEFLQSHIKHDRGIYKNIKERLNELMKCHYQIKPDPSFIGVDHFTLEGQSVIMGWMLNSFDVLVPGLDDKLLEKLSNTLFVDEESKGLISLTFSAFDKDFRSHFLSIIHQLPNDRDLDKMMAWEKDPSSQGFTEAQYAAYVRSTFSRVKGFVSTIDSYKLENNVWTNNLVGPSALAFNAMKEAVASTSTAVWGLFGDHEIALYSKATAKITSTNETGQITSKLLFGKILRDTFVDPNYNEGIVVNYSARKASPKTSEEIKAFILYWNEKLGRYIEKLENGTFKGNKKNLLKNIGKAQAKLAKNLTENPHIIELANATLEAEHRSVMREQVDNFIKKSGKLVDKSFVYGGIALNLWNVIETPVPDKWVFSFSDVDATNSTLKYISNMGYLTQSIIGLQHAKSKAFFKSITEEKLIADTNKNYKVLLKLSLDQAQEKYGDDAAESLLRNIRNFKMLSGAMGVIGIVSAGSNLIILSHALKNSSKSGLNGMEFNLTLALATTSAIQTIEGTIYIMQIFGVLEAGAWVNPAFLVVGIASLLLSFALMYWSRDDIDKWLQQCRFSLEPQLRLWDLNYSDTKTEKIAVEEEYTSLQHLLLTPNVYSEATYRWEGGGELHTGEKIGQNVITGYWLVLYLPGRLTDWEVQIAEVDNNDHVMINPYLSCNPYYLTPEQYKNIKKTGLPSSFAADELESTEIVTGLYMFPLQLNQENGEFVLKINLINDPNAYQYRINSKSIYDGGNVEIEKFALADTNLTPLYLEPMSAFDRFALTYESLTN
jgi:hypothetical protein